MESALSSPPEREIAPQHVEARISEQAEAKRFDPRTQRLLLSAAGLAALVGLGALAALFTAPFADPPEKGTEVPTSIVPPSAAKTMDKPSMPGTTASEALRRMTLEARQRETQGTDAPPPAEALAPDDPRWAKTVTPPAEGRMPEGPNSDDAGPVGTGQEPRQERLATAPQEQQSPLVTGSPPDNPPAPLDQASPSTRPGPTDETATAAISPAETEPEAADTAPEQEPVAAASGAAPSTNVTVTTHVKMRAGPRDEAAVITVIPDNAVVGLVKCESWCEVVYKGRRGFVYKNFIDGRGVAKRP